MPLRTGVERTFAFPFCHRTAGRAAADPLAGTAERSAAAERPEDGVYLACPVDGKADDLASVVDRKSSAVRASGKGAEVGHPPVLPDECVAQGARGARRDAAVPDDLPAFVDVEGCRSEAAVTSAVAGSELFASEPS